MGSMSSAEPTGAKTTQTEAGKRNENHLDRRHLQQTGLAGHSPTDTSPKISGWKNTGETLAQHVGKLGLPDISLAWYRWVEQCPSDDTMVALHLRLDEIVDAPTTNRPGHGLFFRAYVCADITDVPPTQHRCRANSCSNDMVVAVSGH